MQKVRFIYNPYSGENAIVNKLDTVIKIHQNHGYEIVPYRIERGREIDESLECIDKSYAYVLIAGGDGTVDSVLNAMMRKGIKLPIAILPVGTANDFGKFIDMPQDITVACERIVESKPIPLDIGKINDKYFINVASTGLFTDVSQKTDIHLKNAIGKLAYYIKGLEELPNFRKLKVNITSKEYNYNGEMYLLLLFNGKTAGNLNLATKADAQDGMLDLILFKAVPLIEFLPLFLKVLRGDHLDSEKVVYFKTSDVLIECDEDIVTDIDGEKGPEFPLRVQCIKDGIQVLGLKE